MNRQKTIFGLEDAPLVDMFPDVMPKPGRRGFWSCRVCILRRIIGMEMGMEKACGTSTVHTFAPVQYLTRGSLGAYILVSYSS